MCAHASEPWIKHAKTNRYWWNSTALTCVTGSKQKDGLTKLGTPGISLGKRGSPPYNPSPSPIVQESALSEWNRPISVSQSIQRGWTLLSFQKTRKIKWNKPLFPGLPSCPRTLWPHAQSRPFPVSVTNDLIWNGCDTASSLSRFPSWKVKYNSDLKTFFEGGTNPKAYVVIRMASNHQRMVSAYKSFIERRQNPKPNETCTAMARMVMDTMGCRCAKGTAKDYQSTEVHIYKLTWAALYRMNSLKFNYTSV